MSDHNPFAAPSINTEHAFDVREYGGITRGPYFGYSILAGIVNNLLQAGALAAGLGSLVFVLALAGLGVALYLGVLRLKNMGYSGWWTLGFFVPFLNILVAVRCLAAPEGYADHKTLDSTGKIIIGLFLGVVLLVILAVVFSTAIGP